MKKTVGILGGMGPYATCEFFKKILDFTPAKKDWEHLRIIIDNNPHIPSRSRYLLYNEDSPIKGMIESCNRLSKYPVDVIAIPCNSACYFIKDIEKYVNVPILNIIEITSNALVKEYKNIKKVAVLGGAITYYKQTYKYWLNKHKVEYVHHDAEDQHEIENFIEMIKINSINEELNIKLEKFINNFILKYNIDTIILGCTEFGCILNLNLNINNIIDSSTELAKYIVNNYNLEGGY